MDEIIAEFLIETEEGLTELDNALVLLERSPEDEALVSKIFRVFHTIKGSCGFIGLERLGKISHKAEDVLGLVRDKRLQVTPGSISAILKAVDRIKFITDELKKSEKEPEGSDEDVIGVLAALLIPRRNATPEDIAASAESPPAASSDFSSAANQRHERPAPAVEAELAAEVEHGHQTLRVSLDLLDSMMTVVSELVLTRNQLLQMERTTRDSALHAPLQKLNLVVSELQESVIKTRMQPIGNAWTKLPRAVRDVSAELGKKIDLEMHGKETELDRQVLEMIRDPLLHMVRNAADHGIEAPADRKNAGKPEAGRIALKSYHQDGHVMVQISDDGRGLSLEKIKAKALQKGLATKESLDKMSPQQIQRFIFRAGFSTTDQVTSVSGRGVGMDVVRTNIQKIGGTIEMASFEGKGTTFTVKIPMTLAIISALIVEVAGSHFAIPQLSVSEVVMVGGKGGARIEMIKDAAVLRLRDTLLPLIYLGDYLRVLDKGHERAHEDQSQRYVVVTRVAGVQFGMVVDHVLDMEEIVVKPVSRNLKEVQIFCGNTILGDGSVIMILDPAGLMKEAGVHEDAGANAATEETPLIESAARESLLLLFRAGDRTLKAAPLKMVSRLREIETREIELSNGRPVLQHLGQLMPVFSYNDAPIETNKAVLIIFEHEGRSAGLLADQVLDITKYYGSLVENGRDRLLDTIIVNEQSTDVVNPAWYTLSGSV